MDNINIYNERMAKAIEDKLWFIRFLNMPTFNQNAVVYDLGCADGEIIRHLAPIFPDIQFIGIDESEDMINLARQRQFYPNERYIRNSEVHNVDNKKYGISIMIMSSVYHEIVNYNNEPAFKNILSILTPDYIFFRDMIPDETINRKSSIDDLDKLMAKCWNDESRDTIHTVQIATFDDIQGSLMNQRNLVHFLLKYRYVENWRREVKENYFPCTYNELMERFSKLHYQPVYTRQYVLPYIQETVKNDFDIVIRDNTHLNAIFKRIYQFE